MYVCVSGMYCVHKYDFIHAYAHVACAVACAYMRECMHICTCAREYLCACVRACVRACCVFVWICIYEYLEDRNVNYLWLY